MTMAATGTASDETAEGVFLWLAPADAEAPALSALILELSQRLGTPSFEPHLTLLGPLAPAAGEAGLEERAASLAGRLAALTLPLRGVSGEPAFYRALYAAVEPTRALRSARDEARGLCPALDAPFRPHLSLAYGRLDALTQAALSAELAPRLPAEVTARHLDLIRTDGPPQAWRRLRRFDLGGPPA
jgi:2'-5' RNA ligase